MKTINKILTALIVSFFLFAGANAEYRVYDNVTEFEKAKGSVCETATDGCNTFFLTDGKVMGGTEMYCADVKEEWNCTKFKDNVMTTRTLSITTTAIDEPFACTMQYDPVCAEVQVQCITAPCYPIMKTFGNSCSAGKNKIIHEGACTEKKILGVNDENFYNTIKDRLNSKYQDVINKAVYKYEKNLTKFSDSNKEKINKAIIAKVEKKISDLLMKYPQDIALPTLANNKYLTFSLLKFELMKIKY